jgi:hypothetical protein
VRLGAGAAAVRGGDTVNAVPQGEAPRPTFDRVVIVPAHSVHDSPVVGSGGLLAGSVDDGVDAVGRIPGESGDTMWILHQRRWESEGRSVTVANPANIGQLFGDDDCGVKSGSAAISPQSSSPRTERVAARQRVSAQPPFRVLKRLNFLSVVGCAAFE